MLNQNLANPTDGDDQTQDNTSSDPLAHPPQAQGTNVPARPSPGPAGVGDASQTTGTGPVHSIPPSPAAAGGGDPASEQTEAGDPSPVSGIGTQPLTSAADTGGASIPGSSMSGGGMTGSGDDANDGADTASATTLGSVQAPASSTGSQTADMAKPVEPPAAAVGTDDALTPSSTPGQVQVPPMGATVKPGGSQAGTDTGTVTPPSPPGAGAPPIDGGLPQNPSGDAQATDEIKKNMSQS